MAPSQTDSVDLSAANDPVSSTAALSQKSSPDSSLFGGTYKLLQTLGEGEFAKVKLALHPPTKSYVAVKLFDNSLLNDPERSTKLSREIAILKSISHPNIVKLHHVVTTPTQIGLIIQYASGGELFDYILAKRFLKEAEAKRLFAQLVSGVNYLHEHNVVHRDLKLENLLLTDKRDLVIIDFGFANQFPHSDSGIKTKDQRKRVRDADFLMNTSCGSPCYAAPELVIADGYVGTLSDVWSCGVILYSMLAGYLPFDDDPQNPSGDNITLLYKYILSEPTPLHFPPYITECAKDLLKRMIVPDPNVRATMEEVMRHEWLKEYHDFFFGSKISSPSMQTISISATDPNKENIQPMASSSRSSTSTLTSPPIALDSNSPQRKQSPSPPPSSAKPQNRPPSLPPKQFSPAVPEKSVSAPIPNDGRASPDHMTIDRPLSEMRSGASPIRRPKSKQRNRPAPISIPPPPRSAPLRNTTSSAPPSNRPPSPVKPILKKPSPTDAQPPAMKKNKVARILGEDMETIASLPRPSHEDLRAESKDKKRIPLPSLNMFKRTKTASDSALNANIQKQSGNALTDEVMRAQSVPTSPTVVPISSSVGNTQSSSSSQGDNSANGVNASALASKIKTWGWIKSKLGNHETVENKDVDRVDTPLPTQTSFPPPSRPVLNVDISMGGGLNLESEINRLGKEEYERRRSVASNHRLSAKPLPPGPNNDSRPPSVPQVPTILTPSQSTPLVTPLDVEGSSKRHSQTAPNKPARKKSLLQRMVHNDDDVVYTKSEVPLEFPHLNPNFLSLPHRMSARSGDLPQLSPSFRSSTMPHPQPSPISETSDGSSGGRRRSLSFVETLRRKSHSLLNEPVYERVIVPPTPEFPVLQPRRKSYVSQYPEMQPPPSTPQQRQRRRRPKSISALASLIFGQSSPLPPPPPIPASYFQDLLPPFYDSPHLDRNLLLSKPPETTLFEIKKVLQGLGFQVHSHESDGITGLPGHGEGKFKLRAEVVTGEKGLTKDRVKAELELVEVVESIPVRLLNEVAKERNNEAVSRALPNTVSTGSMTRANEGSDAITPVPRSTGDVSTEEMDERQRRRKSFDSISLYSTFSSSSTNAVTLPKDYPTLYSQPDIYPVVQSMAKKQPFSPQELYHPEEELELSQAKPDPSTSNRAPRDRVSTHASRSTPNLHSTNRTYSIDKTRRRKSFSGVPPSQYNTEDIPPVPLLTYKLPHHQDTYASSIPFTPTSSSSSSSFLPSGLLKLTKMVGANRRKSAPEITLNRITNAKSYESFLFSSSQIVTKATNSFYKQPSTGSSVSVASTSSAYQPQEPMPPVPPLPSTMPLSVHISNYYSSTPTISVQKILPNDPSGTGTIVRSSSSVPQSTIRRTDSGHVADSPSGTGIIQSKVKDLVERIGWLGGDRLIMEIEVCRIRGLDRVWILRFKRVRGGAWWYRWIREVVAKKVCAA